MPPGQDIPKHVQRVTGISEKDLAQARTEAEVWSAVCRTAADVAARNHMAICPTVIHYARFEKPFLETLHQTHTPIDPFPFDIICTHAIAARLLPDLPRRGIRAVAGFFGFSIGQERRSGGHAQATLHIWQRLLTLLSSRYRIDTFEALKQWLIKGKPEAAGKRKYPMAPDHHRNLPDTPGVYRMRRINADLLYVGKAKSLKKRVNSYFRPNAPHAEHILEMLTQARSIDVTPTKTALEAAMLEVEEIKKWSPPYNIALKADQNRTLFFNRDLTDFSHLADDQYCLGPLPENQTGDTLAAFGKWMATDMPLEEAGGAGGRHKNTKNDSGSFAGCAMPDSRSGPVPNGLPATPAKDNTVSSIKPFGTEFWLEHQREKAGEGEITAEDDAQSDPMTPPDEQPDPKDRWTPEMVEKVIKGQIRRWAHLLRRARWFCVLSESSLLWTLEKGFVNQNHLLVMTKGNVLINSCQSSVEGPPPTPDHGRSFARRRNDLDMAAYDRLRVLTTEIRRILSENRRICICVGPNAVLTPRSLNRLFQWI